MRQEFRSQAFVKARRELRETGHIFSSISDETIRLDSSIRAEIRQVPDDYNGNLAAHFTLCAR
jgi:hypothetical protein